MHDHSVRVREKTGNSGLAVSFPESPGNKNSPDLRECICHYISSALLFKYYPGFIVPDIFDPVVCVNVGDLETFTRKYLQTLCDFQGSLFYEF